MSKAEIIEVLRQAYEELDFEDSPTAEDMANVIFYLAKEWDITLGPRTS